LIGAGGETPLRPREQLENCTSSIWQTAPAVWEFGADRPSKVLGDRVTASSKS